MSKKNEVIDPLLQRLFEMIGAIKMADASAKFSNAAKYSLYKQLHESKAYKKLGMDWEEFCKEYLGRDRKTIEGEIKLLEEFGEYFMRAVERLHLTKRDLLALDKGLPEEVKAEIRKGVLTVGERKFKLSELDENVDEFSEAIDWLNKKASIAEKEKHVLEKEIKHRDKKEAEHKHKIEELEKELQALKPPTTEEEKKKRFEEQLEFVYKHLGEAGKLMNHVMDFSLALNDRELAVKYRGAVKAITSVAMNLERKIGEA